jgi:hypothetical protein
MAKNQNHGFKNKIKNNLKKSIKIGNYLIWFSAFRIFGARQRGRTRRRAVFA